jgi:hypothetical protein
MICEPTSPNSPIRPRLAGPNGLQEQQWVSEIRRRAQLMKRARAGSDRADSGVVTVVVGLLVAGGLLATSSVRRGYRRRQNAPPRINAVAAAVIAKAAFVPE